MGDDDWEEDIKALIREEEAERKRKMSLNIPSPLDFVSLLPLNVAMYQTYYTVWSIIITFTTDRGIVLAIIC